MSNSMSIEDDVNVENDAWYDYLLNVLAERKPKKARLVEDLMELLCIERESAYRRLRKDVSFSIEELVKIALAWNVSLDEIIGVHSGKIPFMMHLVNYFDPSEQEVQFLQQIAKSVDQIKKFPDMEFMNVCNKLPRSLYAGFAYLDQFHLFKWQYQYGEENNIVPFSKSVISERGLQLAADYCQAIKQMPNMSYIWDRMIFEYLINDIQYFHSIRLITDEEKALIKKDLRDLLDYMLLVASNGYFPETQNKVNLYISQLYINTNYSYVYTPNTKVCFVQAFDRYKIHSYNTEMMTRFRTWMQLKRKTSTQISEVDEKSRIGFFMKQQQLVDSM